MNTKNIIEVKNLCYKYLTSRRLDGGFSSYKEVLKEINFSVGRGEKLSIIGHNGAGKSTLMLNIAGLMDGKCRSGEIFIYGKRLDEKNIYDIREKIGFVFQDPNDQLFSIKVFDDVSFGLINYLNKKKDRRAKNRQYIEEIVRISLRKVNLGNIEDEIPHFR
jgi:energy-coupling factor transporter ATP-binding protein EcfA2